MSDTARDIQSSEAASTEGLEKFFEVEVVPGATEDYQVAHTEDLSGVSVDEAAKILQLSPKTIKDRLRKGSLRGFKAKDKFGERWLVCLDFEASVAPTELKGVPGEDGVVHGGNGSKSVTPTLLVGHTDSQNNELLKAYKEQIKDLQNQLQAASYRLGYLEHERSTHLEQIKLLTDSQHKPSWWQRFKAFFVKQ
jgi:hypothetical protein